MLKTAIFIIACVLASSCMAEQMNVNPSNYQGRMSAFKQRNPSHVAIITAKWCSDCQANRKLLEQMNNVAILHEWPVLDADVGTRDEFRDPENYVRKDELYHTGAVPTVYIIRNGVITDSIIDQQIYDQDLTKAFIKKIEEGVPTQSTNE